MYFIKNKTQKKKKNQQFVKRKGSDTPALEQRICSNKYPKIRFLNQQTKQCAPECCWFYCDALNDRYEK